LNGEAARFEHRLEFSLAGMSHAPGWSKIRAGLRAADREDSGRFFQDQEKGAKQMCSKLQHW
jgi:hypothetical protein